MKTIFNMKTQVVNRSLLTCISRTSTNKTSLAFKPNKWISKCNFHNSLVNRQENQTSSTSKTGKCLMERVLTMKKLLILVIKR